MAGWTIDSGVVPSGVWDKDKHHLSHFSAACYPTTTDGQTRDWQDFVFQVTKEFAELAKRKNWGTTLRVQANNSTGDTNGVGTLTVTFTVA